MQLPAHGANAATLYEALQLPMPATIIDVSENVNSAGLPDKVKEQWGQLVEKASAYPHEQAEPFRSLVAGIHGVPVDNITVTNGAAEGLMVLAQYFNGQHVALLEPSFSEYRRTLTQQNCTIHSVIVDDVTTYKIDAQKVVDVLVGARVLYMCNPNNPTGALLEKAWIEALVKQHPACSFVVDEAFMDWTDEAESVIELTNRYPNLFVLRSMTKMFAIAGIRLGYVIGQRVRDIAAYLPHWNVGGVAIEVGCICMNETDFIEQARKESTALRLMMTHDLEQLGCTVSKSAANFLLFCLPEHLSTEHFFEVLLANGIVLRHTKNYVGLEGKWFRIAVKTEEVWQKCKEEIERYVSSY